MGLDYRTIAIYGWKVKGNKNVRNLIDELEEWNEDYFDETDDIMIEDTMCGDYIYFGAILAYFDPTEDNQEVIINDDLIAKKTKKWNKYIKDNPKFLEIINKYKSGDAQLFVFSHIW